MSGNSPCNTDIQDFFSMIDGDCGLKISLLSIFVTVCTIALLEFLLLVIMCGCYMRSKCASHKNKAKDTALTDDDYSQPEDHRENFAEQEIVNKHYKRIGSPTKTEDNNTHLYAVLEQDQMEKQQQQHQQQDLQQQKQHTKVCAQESFYDELKHEYFDKKNYTTEKQLIISEDKGREEEVKAIYDEIELSTIPRKHNNAAESQFMYANVFTDNEIKADTTTPVPTDSSVPVNNDTANNTSNADPVNEAVEESSPYTSEQQSKGIIETTVVEEYADVVLATERPSSSYLAHSQPVVITTIESEVDPHVEIQGFELQFAPSTPAPDVDTPLREDAMLEMTEALYDSVAVN